MEYKGAQTVYLEGNCLPFQDCTDCILLDGADAKRTRVVGGSRRSHSSKGAGGEEIGVPRRPVMRQERGDK